MPHFRVFVGPPPASSIGRESSSYQWRTVSSTPGPPHGNTTPDDLGLVLPPATLEAASVRISLIYRNVIFDEDGEDVEDVEKWEHESQDDSTLITWPPTDPRGLLLKSADLSDAGASRSHRSSMHETQETQDTGSFAYSDASSIACFPTFHIKLHALTPLSALPLGTRKTSVVVAVLEVEGPDFITIKKGVDAGKEVALLKFIVGDESGGICKLTAWREVAECWGGRLDDPAVLRGDVVSVENVVATHEAGKSPALTASRNLNSKLVICYRTMPNSRDDRRLRPDLRLGASDAAVRKVSTTVRWFQGLAGLS